MKRLFIDCSHTSMYPFKKGGIHRVVRKISHELVNLGQHTDLEIKLISFDGVFIQEISLYSLSVKEKPLKITVLNKKLGRKIRKIGYLAAENLGLSTLFNHLYQSAVRSSSNIRFRKDDIYLILDANWDLSDNYYDFLASLKPLGVEVALLCYDLIPIKFPEFCSRNFSNSVKHFYSKYSNVSDAVICISNKIKEDYFEFLDSLHLDESKRPKLVTSFQLGSDFSTNELKEASGKENVSSKLPQSNAQSIESLLPEEVMHGSYFLVVGSLVPHKNIKTVITAFDLFSQENDQYYLIFVGNRGWHPETDHIIESDPWFEKRIFILEDLSDEQLGEIYSNCFALIQASFYEGYGLPVVEALQRGKPVICSTGGSLPEVGGDLCLYFDPYDSLELYKRLQQITASSEYYESLLHRIRTEYHPVSWEVSAQQLLDRLYELSSLSSHF
jgi:glycosyltransferase involved in cell wall biosynthesis